MEFFATGRGEERGKTKLFVSCCWQVVTTATTAPSARPPATWNCIPHAGVLGPLTQTLQPLRETQILHCRRHFVWPQTLHLPNQNPTMLTSYLPCKRQSIGGGVGQEQVMQEGSAEGHIPALKFILKNIYNIDYKLLTNFKRKPCV